MASAVPRTSRWEAAEVGPALGEWLREEKAAAGCLVDSGASEVSDGLPPSFSLFHPCGRYCGSIG